MNHGIYHLNLTEEQDINVILYSLWPEFQTNTFKIFKFTSANLICPMGPGLTMTCD